MQHTFLDSRLLKALPAVRNMCVELFFGYTI